MPCFLSASPTNAWSFCQVLGFLSSFGEIGSDMVWASISYSMHWLDWWVEGKCSTKHVLHIPYTASLLAHCFFRKTFAHFIVKWDCCLMNNKTKEMMNTVYLNFLIHNVLFWLHSIVWVNMCDDVKHIGGLQCWKSII